MLPLKLILRSTSCFVLVSSSPLRRTVEDTIVPESFDRVAGPGNSVLSPTTRLLSDVNPLGVGNSTNLFADSPAFLASRTFLSINVLSELDDYRKAHSNLTLVDAYPTRAAMYPSFINAIVQIFVLSAFTVPACMTNSARPRSRSSEWRLQIWRLGLVFILFGIWLAAFIVALCGNRDTAGWLAAVEWIPWFVIAADMRALDEQDATHVARIPLFFGICHLGLSYAAVFMRLAGRIGSVAYLITDAHGCQPSKPGDFGNLQRGSKFWTYGIQQAFMLIASTWATVLTYLPRRTCGLGGLGGWYLILILFIITFWETIEALISDTERLVVAVDGSCLLAEFNGRHGFFDLPISTAWKVLGALMAF